MGNANSTSLIKNITEMLSEQVVDLLNEQTLLSLQNQSVNIKDTKGDVIMKGNTFSGEANIDFESLMEAATTQTATQDIMQKISNQAESMNKDLNILQNANAYSELQNYVSSAISLSTGVVQKCTGGTTQSQSINVETTGGNVIVTNNTFKQTSSIISKCIQKSEVEQKSIQELQQTLDNSAKATNIGVNIWAIVALALISLLATVAPTLIATWGAGKVAGSVASSLAGSLGSKLGDILLKTVFIILLVVGIALIILYYTDKKNTIETISHKATIGMLENECGAVKSGKPSNVYNNVQDASKECLESDHIGFDFIKIGKNSAETTFYSSMNKQCQNSVKNSAATIQYIEVKKPFVALNIPKIDRKSYKFKDLLLNVTDGYLYMAKKTIKTKSKGDKTEELGWYPVSDEEGNSVRYIQPGVYTTTQVIFRYGEYDKTKDKIQKGDDKAIIKIPYLSQLSDNLLTPWVVVTDKGVEEKTPPNDFNYDAVNIKDIQNVSGFNVKVKKHGKFFMALSIAFIIVGTIGTTLQFIGGKKKTQMRIK